MVLLQFQQRAIGMFQGVCSHVGPQRNFRCQAQAFADIAAGDISHGTQGFFPPKVPVVVQPAQDVPVTRFLTDGIYDQAPSRRQRLHRGHNGQPGRGGIDNGVEAGLRPICCVSGPGRTQLRGERPFLVAACEYVKKGIRIEVLRDLQNQVARCAKAGQAQLLSVFNLTQLERPVSNGSRAQQRSCFLVANLIRNGVGERFGNDHVFCVAPRRVAATGTKIGAQVFLSIQAPLTVATGRVDPGDPDAFVHQVRRACRALANHAADDLVPGCHR